MRYCEGLEKKKTHHDNHRQWRLQMHHINSSFPPPPPLPLDPPLSLRMNDISLLKAAKSAKYY